ncbi:MAG: hypothetical protein JWR18_3509, partial [Segetibacter sp.]|nr:hypothetical protein [Segetibacter sp.]
AAGNFLQKERSEGIIQGIRNLLIAFAAKVP